MSSHYLATPLRRALEKTIKAARIVAEEGANDALRRLGVADTKAPSYLTEEERALRRRLRAQARALGDQPNDGASPPRLAEAAAYAHWHRMLFARFLAERGLLRHPEHGVSVTLADCRELAEEEGLADPWAVAERYAGAMLPAVFRVDDPVLGLALDAAKVQGLHRLVADLNPDVFAAEDSLGWTYQFWRAAEKDAVNKSGVKIGAAELPAVTQLFTEPYMVRFLLHNTLGAWRAGKVLATRPELAEGAVDEAELRVAVSPPGYAFDMLRFVREGDDAPRWRPAAGTFPGWPATAAAIRALDPCCGSGHFLTELLAILAALRADEEELGPVEAVAAVLRDNLFGLEIDGRCVQIAAFAVALTAWRIGGFQPLPAPHVAWVGAPPPLPKAELVALANGDEELASGLAALHDVFSQAPFLGSLINPTSGDLMSPQRLGRIEPLLDCLVEKSRAAEPERQEGAIAARGMADAAAILARRYTLMATNVPFQSEINLTPEFVGYLRQTFPAGRPNLATSMIERMLNACCSGGTCAFVSPQSWYYMSRYIPFRLLLRTTTQLKLCSRLGSGAFSDAGSNGENVCLTISSIGTENANAYTYLDASPVENWERKSSYLSATALLSIEQTAGGLDAPHIGPAKVADTNFIRDNATGLLGISTGDSTSYIRFTWEQILSSKWELLQSSPNRQGPAEGRSMAILWENETGRLSGAAYALRGVNNNIQNWRRGKPSWSRPGVVISLMSPFASTLYSGDRYDSNCFVLVPRSPDCLEAIWAYCDSGALTDDLARVVGGNRKAEGGTVLDLTFDLSRWTRFAVERYPNGLPGSIPRTPPSGYFTATRPGSRREHSST